MRGRNMDDFTTRSSQYISRVRSYIFAQYQYSVARSLFSHLKHSFSMSFGLLFYRGARHLKAIVNVRFPAMSIQISAQS